MENFQGRGVWIQDPDPVLFPGSESDLERIMDPDPVCPEKLDPNPVCPRGRIRNPDGCIMQFMIAIYDNI